MPQGSPRVAVVIEDDPEVRDLLETILTDAGFSCQTTDSGVLGIEAVQTYQPILTTLDIGLPGIDGFEVTRRIRAFSSTYIIILSARNEEGDTLMALDAGADDYVTKPFRPRELRARIEAMLRRHKVITDESRADESRADSDGSPPWEDSETRPSPDEDDELTEAGWLVHNGLRVNPDMRLCELDNQPLDLTRSEFQLLVAIMRGHRRVISKNTLALDLRDDGMVEGYVSESDRRVVESHMAHLRRKLNDPVRSPRFIETVRGVGYRLTARQNPPPTPG